MKTKLLLILLIAGLSTTVSAQFGGVHVQVIDKFSEIDTARYLITYSLDVVMDSTRAQTKNDELRLEIGAHLSKTYSLRAYKADSVATDLIRKRIDELTSTPGEPLPEVIFKNYPSGKLTFISRSMGGVLRYEEDYPVAMKWKLLPEKKELLGYTCQKAETTFRGRHYTAWFTQEIPLKEGPGKFGGLPGLILQLSDSQNHFSYLCVGIEEPKTITTIKYWTWGYTDLTRKKYLKVMKQVYDNPMPYIRARGGNIYYGGKQEIPVEKVSFPYNPMERE